MTYPKEIEAESLKKPNEEETQGCRKLTYGQSTEYWRGENQEW